MLSTSSPAARRGVETIMERYTLIANATNFAGFDRHLMASLRLIDAGDDGSVEWELDITPYWGNLNGVMHGGAAGVIFDMGTTTALGPLSKEGYWDFMGGVTRTLNISYLRAIPIGTTIRIHSKVLQVGRTMALIRGTMTSVDGKTVYCTCEHHKVHVAPLPEHVKYVSSNDGQHKDSSREASSADGKEVDIKGKL